MQFVRLLLIFVGIASFGESVLAAPSNSHRLIGYINSQYGFSIEYPSYFQPVQTKTPFVVSRKGSVLLYSESDQSESFSIKVHEVPLDGFVHPDEPAGDGYTYSEKTKKWSSYYSNGPSHLKKHQLSGSLIAHYLVSGDGGGSYEVAYIESPLKNYVIEFATSRSDDDPEKNHSDQKTLFTILDSFRFTELSAQQGGAVDAATGPRH